MNNIKNKMKKQEPGTTFDKVIAEGFRALQEAHINLKIAQAALTCIANVARTYDREMRRKDAIAKDMAEKELWGVPYPASMAGDGEPGMSETEIL